MKKFLLLGVIGCLLLSSCTGEDAFAAKAYRLRAEQGFKEIRNALAEYKIDHNQYPGEENWVEELKPYFRKERSPAPQWVTGKRMLVMNAKNNITQIKGVLRELKRKVYYADSAMQVAILEYLNPIDSALLFAGYEVNEARKYEYRDISSELKGLFDYASNLNILNEKRAILERMESRKGVLRDHIQELKDCLLELEKIDSVTVVSLFEMLNRIIEEELLYVKGEKPTSFGSSAGYANQIENLILKMDKKKDSLLIKDLKEMEGSISSYVGVMDNIEFLDFLDNTKKKIPAITGLFSDYYNKNREAVLEANKMLNSYSSLDNLRSLVHFYEEKSDSIPEGNLFTVFAEEEDMKEIRNDLGVDPYLYLDENGYRLESTALDKEQTKIVLNIEFINTYKFLVEESFSSGPFYYTDDSNSTFFIVVKARDKGQTIITSRSKFRGVKTGRKSK